MGGGKHILRSFSSEFESHLLVMVCGSEAPPTVPHFLSHQRAIDEKFRCLEEKEGDVRRLQLALREKEMDQEKLRCVLSNNEETILVLRKAEAHSYTRCTFTVLQCTEITLSVWVSVSLCVFSPGHVPSVF